MTMLLSSILIFSILGGIISFLYNKLNQRQADRMLADMALKQSEMRRALEAQRLNLDKEGEDYEKAYNEFVAKYGVGSTDSEPSKSK